jgi:hypothetical protein
MINSILRQIYVFSNFSTKFILSKTGKGKGLAVYPNLVSSLLNVVYTVTPERDGAQGDKESSFQILNPLGQQVLTGKTPPSGAGGLDVSALPQGTYILKVGAEQAKFLKQ